MKKCVLILALLLALSGCGAADATGGDTQDETAPDVSSEEPQTGGDNAAETPDTDADAGQDVPMMVMVNGKIYVSSGEISTVDGRCGNMDGNITSSVADTESPTENNQSNFGEGYGFQYGGEDTIEVLMDDQWIVFRAITDSDV